VQLLGKAWRVSLGVLALIIGAQAVPAAAAADAEASKADPALLAKADELWKKRDQPAAEAEMKALIDKGLAAAPNDYAILWRAAAWHFWTSEDPARSHDEKIKLAKTGWDLGERAVAQNPQGVEGQFFTTVDIGNYSLGIGILRALAQRIEGKFLGHLREAERLNPRFADGGIQVTRGRYHATLPWPKYDAKKAIAAFQQAIEVNPSNLRARVFLAEVLLDEGQAAQAKRLLDDVAKATPGRYDAPEERRAQSLGAALLPKVLAAIKK
jgi:tetratricopeptide (TPR) repeat protein